MAHLPPVKVAPDRSSRRRWGRRALGIALGLLLGLVCGEIYARLTVPDPDNAGPPAIFTSSPLIPFTTRPLAEHLNIQHPRGDYVYSAHLDAGGFRRNGPEPVAANLDGLGTLILGDSFAFGMGVDDDQTVAAELVRSEFNGTCLGPFVNGGWIAGNNPATLAAWLAGQPESLRPRALLHLVFPTNDLDDIVPLDLLRDDRGNLIRIKEQAAYVDASGRRRFGDQAGLRGTRDWLRNHLRLYYPLYQMLRTMFPQTFGEGRMARRDLEGALDVAIRAMQQAERWAAARAASYTVVFIPSVEEVWARHWQVRGAVLLAAGRAARLDAIDLLAGEPRLTTDNYYRYDAHWNPSGHTIVARQLISRLSARATRTCT